MAQLNSSSGLGSKQKLTWGATALTAGLAALALMFAPDLMKTDRAAPPGQARPQKAASEPTGASSSGASSAASTAQPASDSPRATPDKPAAPSTPLQRPKDPRRFGIEGPVKRPPGAFRFATYNVQNLFYGEPGAAPDPRQPAKDPEHLAALAQVLRAIDADVVALQEVESKESLIRFRDEHLKDLRYDHVCSIDAGDSRGIENSVLSRFPLSREKLWKDAALDGTHPAPGPESGAEARDLAGKPLRFRRAPLSVDVTVPGTSGAPGYTFTLIVMHHKSGRDFSYWREAESRGVLQIIDGLQKADPDRNIVIAGDFNALARDKSVQNYVSGSGITGGLIDTFADRTRDARWITHESGRSIDFVLVNSAMKPEVITESRFILGTPARPAGVDWRSYPEPEGYVSDHYPVVVDFTPKDK